MQKHTQWRDRLPALPKWPSWRMANKKRPQTDSKDSSALKRKCSTRSKVGHFFTSGATALLIREACPEQAGVVVSKDAPKPKESAKDLFDMSLDEVLSDVEWEPTKMEILMPEVSLVVIEPEAEKELEKEHPVNLDQDARDLLLLDALGESQHEDRSPGLRTRSWKESIGRARSQSRLRMDACYWVSQEK